MALSGKSLRAIESLTEAPLDFDFGEPEVIAVEIAPGKFLSLHEPSAENLIEIDKISEDKDLNEIDATLKTICILHKPDEGGRKLTLKDARKLRAKQIKALGVAINTLLGNDPEEKSKDLESEDNSTKSNDQD